LLLASFLIAAGGGLMSDAAQRMVPAAEGVRRFSLRAGSLMLERPTHAGAFFDVVGRRAALLGYEHRTAEAWVYPLEVFDEFSLSFRLEGYPLEIAGRDVMARIEVRPETTTLVYAHAAFTVRQVMFAPIDEPGIVILLDVKTTLPIAITASFRPRLRLMWPATSMTANLSWDEAAHVYDITEESRHYAALVGCPLARDVSVMPYQEEPRDAPNRFVIERRPDALAREYIPIVIAASIEGQAAAKAAYDRIVASIPSLYERTADHYERLDRETVGVTTPDSRLDTAFRWAKVGVDKGVATNPLLGTGLLAGFRTAGDSERPGYAWFFGRDALWTTLATTSSGAFETTRTALEFLRKYQRDDGKIPHEISQSAPLVRWFDAYPYAWASADATPLYVIANADYWRASGDRAFVEQAWSSIVKAFRFSATTDSDGNGLIENTNVGHGWVEGGALYPPHEEIYLEGLWIAACEAIVELADLMGDAPVGASARASAQRARDAIEKTYWLDDRGFYAFATAPPRSGSRLVEEDTVLPSVPLWFGTTRDDHAQREIDHLASAAIATDWGARILSNRSVRYDPLSYHYGSVWPLFTGWAAVAAYRHGRPHAGYQALMANALLTFPGALGYVTELLSGDFATPFGRSSHHQVWSEAMVITPVMRGLLGIDVSDGGRTVRAAPSVPATWDRVEVNRVHAGTGQCDLTFERSSGRLVVRMVSRGNGARRVVLAPAFPLDARVRRVTVDGATVQHERTVVGDVQREQVTVEPRRDVTQVVFSVDEGTDVYAEPRSVESGGVNDGLRIIHARPGAAALNLTVEGRGGRAYVVTVRSPRRIGDVAGVRLLEPTAGEQRMEIQFSGPAEEYVRREIAIPLR
jgi:glycogen debranching enzyme